MDRFDRSYVRRRFLQLAAMAGAAGAISRLPGFKSSAQAATVPDKKPDKIIMRTWGRALEHPHGGRTGTHVYRRNGDSG